jgi:hypothetical protein
LLIINDDDIINSIIVNNTMQIMVDYLIKFMWNNLLHVGIEICFINMLNNKNNLLIDNVHIHSFYLFIINSYSKRKRSTIFSLTNYKKCSLLPRIRADSNTQKAMCLISLTYLIHLMKINMSMILSLKVKGGMNSLENN